MGGSRNQAGENEELTVLECGGMIEREELVGRVGKRRRRGL